jgi:hyperosmotically inducible periplasmic protein
VTPGGQIVSENSFAGAQVVADQIAVIPVGIEKEAEAVNYDLDEGIEKNLDAALIQNKLHHDVKLEVKSGVVTLSEEVNSRHKRDRAETEATRVPSVKQVVNDLHAKKPESQLFLI